ncbi:MAG TPA: metallophosphoesterase family protein [Actinomycetota bacterium]|nr:metallophosphoesterase family protein [Actinomycetota bacterium]
MKVAVLADTHTRGMTRTVPMGAWPYLESSDHILHAGDVVDPTLLHELAALAPLTVVMGNCDGMDVREWGAGGSAQVTLGGIVIGMLHDAGPKTGRHERMRAQFPEARVVVFGHSHIPWNEDRDGLLLFNPGSPTWKRQAPFTSMGLLWIEDGNVEGEIFPV